MRKVILYIAMSLDGYIADSHGNVDWLNGQDGDAESMDTFSAFIKDIDTVVMGWNTYHQVTTELSPNEWVYSALTSYILTHKALPSTENLRFVQDEYYIAIIPTLLGSGIRLWGKTERELKLRLVQVQSYNGITELVYIPRNFP